MHFFLTMKPFELHKKLNEILQQTLLDKEIALQDLDNIEQLPDFCKTFILKETDRYLAEIHQMLKSFSFFPKDSPAFEKVLEGIIAELKKQIRFSPDDFQNLLLQSLKLRYNFLRKPNSTLLFFIFGNSFQKNISEISVSLEYFCDYHQILNIVREKINNYPKREINIYDFNNVFFEAEVKFFNFSTSEELAEFFDPVFEFFNSNSQKFSAPVEIFVDILSDLNLHHFSKTIQSYCQKNNISSIDRETLLRLINQIVNETKSFIEPRQIPSEQQNNNIISFTNLQPFALHIPEDIPRIEQQLLSHQESQQHTIIGKKEEIDEIKALLSKFETGANKETREQEEKPVAPAAEITTEIFVDQENEIKTKEQTLTTNIVDDSYIENLEAGSTHKSIETDEFQTHIEAQLEETLQGTQFEEQDSNAFPRIEMEIVENPLENETNPTTTSDVDEKLSFETPSQNTQIQPLNEMIDEQKRKQLIEELFYAIEEEYNKLINEIDKCNNFEQAMEYVNQYFTEFGIYPEMPVAKEFVELVKQKFFHSNNIE